MAGVRGSRGRPLVEHRSVHEQVFGVVAPTIDSSFGAVSMERAVDGLWSRPGLAMRDRRLITLTVLAASANDAALDAHLDGAVRSGDLDANELEEAAVHLAHYAGWPVGARFAAAAERALDRHRRMTSSAAPVGVVGVGALGADVAAALMASGATVHVHDARPEVAEQIEGATAVAELATLAAACDVISIVVRDGPQVLDVVRTIAAAARPGTVVLVHSTVTTEVIEQAAALAHGAGLSLLDVGLCRPAGMDSGLVALVGGDDEVAAAAAPVIAAIARRGVHRLGPLGAGMVVKALRNAVLYGAYASVSEAIDVARAAGIDVDELVGALRSTGASGSAGLAFVTYRNEWTDGEGAAPDQRLGFVELAHKDIAAAADAGVRVGVGTPFAAAVADAMPAAYLTAARDS